VVCGVDDNPARVTTAQYFRKLSVPVIYTAVSADADHGYVLIQEPDGPCVGCLFPGVDGDESFPCPGTPAIADILQLMGAFATYAIDRSSQDEHALGTIGPPIYIQESGIRRRS
jgi:hypothetical protein